ncbi:MAG TPA: beta-ketoacyl-[acyl-carrier-protein] synthase family protein [Deltaproteobacteria bacterium]|nr:beta-ketoacyl-[acyl-carrier-protein] synthase family protein [Deltaproteobacteria bacterium]HQB37713.1 beta-ketoacyl-[acyl-carrier-protein] synthase family protein [Deltaproteobacteria bacterium]
MTIKRVAITGIGVFCGAGKGIKAFNQALQEGVSGIGTIDLIDTTPFTTSIGAQVKAYDPSCYFSPHELRRLSRADQFGLIAADEALQDSGVRDHYAPWDLGVSMGAGAAGMFQSEFWLKARLEGGQASPALLRGLLPDRTTTEIAQRFKLCGYQGSITTACSSSATAIGWGADLIATGRQKAVLAGGSDTLSVLTYAGFNSLKVVDVNPCSPFSLGRNGISLGEGAACLVLENEETAQRRGAKIHGYVLGYALAGEAFHMTAPEPTGTTAARVMAAAIKTAGIAPEEVGWVNAHGTGTPLNDVVESNAMKTVFGERVSQVPLVSTKAMTGHCLGAAGAIEALATLLSLEQGFIPQTLNFRGRDPECDLDYCHGGRRDSDCRIALSNSFAFGGNITTLVLGK